MMKLWFQASLLALMCCVFVTTEAVAQEKEIKISGEVSPLSGPAKSAEFSMKNGVITLKVDGGTTYTFNVKYDYSQKFNLYTISPSDSSEFIPFGHYQESLVKPGKWKMRLFYENAAGDQMLFEGYTTGDQINDKS